MDKRLTIQDLAGMLAQYAGKDKKETERFLREFVAVVTEGVYADRLVKVKGLGVFKVIAVEKRESVRVNTGERFVIPAHYKFSFLPDKGLREQVNRPFSFFETTELASGVDFADMDVFSEEPIDSEDGSETETEDVPVEESRPEPPLQQPVEPEKPVEKPVEPNEKTIKRKRWPVWVCVMGIVAAGVSLYLFRKKPVVVKEKVVAERVEVRDTLLRTFAPDTLKTTVPARKTIAQVKIEPGSRLTLVALKYYGHKFFWVYIYEYNKAVIRDPNNIPIGTLLDVPAPEIYGIDSHSSISLEKAAARQTEILEGNR